jgi:hypothetical protein
MYKGLRAWAIGGLHIIIQDIVECINVVAASCPCSRGIKYFIKDIVKYIDVEGASCLGNRGIKYLYAR